MSDIVLSAGVRSNLLQLQQTSDLITSTQDRLATGKKVNSALDNAINFFTAQGLDNRANDLSSLLDSMSNGINTIQAANNGITAITKLVQSAQSLVSQAQQANNTTTQATLVHAVRRPADPDRPARWRLGLQRHQPARRQYPDRDAERNGQFDRHRDRRQLYQRQRDAPLSIANAANNWASRHGHHRGFDRSDRRAHLAAVGVADPQRQPVDRADPPGFHQGDNQHAADRFCRPHAGRLQPGRRQPARVADPPATVVHRVVSRFAGRPERAAAVPLSFVNIPTENGGLRAAVFLRPLKLWLTKS